MIKYAHTKEKIHSVQKKKASTHIVSGLISAKIIFRQKNPKKYNEAEIREAYEELIRFIYKNSIEPKLK